MKEKLEIFRKEIDKIDFQILELLDKRAAIVEKVGKLKEQEQQDYSFIKADREADMINELLSRRQKTPKNLIINIWRNIISSSLQIEQKFSAYLYQQYNISSKTAAYLGNVIPVNVQNKPKANEIKELLNNNNIFIFSEDEGEIWKFLEDNLAYKIFAKITDQKIYYFCAKLKSSPLMKKNLYAVRDSASNKVVFRSANITIVEAEVVTNATYIGGYTDFIE